MPFSGITGLSSFVPRFMANFDLVKRKGTLVSVGNASGAVDPIAPLKLSPKNLKLVRPRYPQLPPLSVRTFTDRSDDSMANYVVTPEEADHYSQ